MSCPQVSPECASAQRLWDLHHFHKQLSMIIHSSGLYSRTDSYQIWGQWSQVLQQPGSSWLYYNSQGLPLLQQPGSSYGSVVLCLGPVAFMLCLQQGQRCYSLGQWPYFMFTTITGKWLSTYCSWLLLWASGLMLHQWCMKDNNKLHQSFQHGARGSCFAGNLLTSVTSIMQLWLNFIFQ